MLTRSGRGLDELGSESQVFLPMMTELKPSPSVRRLKRAMSLANFHGRLFPFPMYPSSSMATIVAIFMRTPQTEISPLIASWWI